MKCSSGCGLMHQRCRRTPQDALRRFRPEPRLLRSTGNGAIGRASSIFPSCTADDRPLRSWLAGLAACSDGSDTPFCSASPLRTQHPPSKTPRPLHGLRKLHHCTADKRLEQRHLQDASRSAGKQAGMRAGRQTDKTCNMLVLVRASKQNV